MLGNSQVICFLGGLNTLGHRGIRARREKVTGELIIFATLYISHLVGKQPDAVKYIYIKFGTFFLRQPLSPCLTWFVKPHPCIYQGLLHNLANSVILYPFYSHSALFQPISSHCCDLLFAESSFSSLASFVCFCLLLLFHCHQEVCIFCGLLLSRKCEMVKIGKESRNFPRGEGTFFHANMHFLP